MRTSATKKTEIERNESSPTVPERIAKFGGWRAETIARVRALIVAADPQITEELKWKKAANPDGVPVWSRHGIVCTGEAYASHVKFTFANGAFIADPKRIFNASLDGNQRRAIDLREGDRLEEAAFTELVRAAVAYNMSKKK